MSVWSWLARFFAPRPTPRPLCGVAVVVRRDTNTGAPVVGAQVVLQWAGGVLNGTTNRDGYVAFAAVPKAPTVVTISVAAADYVPYSGPYTFGAANQNVPVALALAHVDPSTIPLGDLARVRGSIWSTQCDDYPLPGGPKPDQPGNIIATVFWSNYDAPARAAAARTLLGSGFTHCAVGPFTDSDGYHGMWRPTDWMASQASWDAFLDILQDLWDRTPETPQPGRPWAGLAPVVFGKPDAMDPDAFMAQAEPFLAQPRAQRLIRLFVPMGWEPTRYKYSSYTYAAIGAWARRVLPNALIVLHQESDCDAPVGTDWRGDDNGHDNAIGWQRVAPFYHIWAVQTGAFGNVDTNPASFQDFCDLFNPSVRGSYQDRFQHGYAGWPTTSAWGDAPIAVVAFEYASYWRVWHHRSQDEAYRWGDGALAAGADGYCDGGTVDVPRRR